MSRNVPQTDPHFGIFKPRERMTKQRSTAAKAVRPKATEKGGMVATATLMKRKEAPQMRLSINRIRKFLNDIFT
jgi:hypothetical protein